MKNRYRNKARRAQRVEEAKARQAAYDAKHGPKLPTKPIVQPRSAVAQVGAPLPGFKTIEQIVVGG